LADFIQVRVTGVQNKRQMARIELLAENTAFTVTQPEVDDSSRQVGLSGQPQSILQVVSSCSSSCGTATSNQPGRAAKIIVRPLYPQLLPKLLPSVGTVKEGQQGTCRP
jgi:hypothetical protein